MTQATLTSPSLRFLEDRWDPGVAAALDPAELLRYRSNLLGSDLRITNFAGGNTSSKIAAIESLSDEELRSLLADFHATRTLTGQSVDPANCAEAILFLAGPKSHCTTGHLIPVDGGLTEGFLR